MSIENVRDYLKKWDLDKNIMEFDISSATVSQAAIAVGVESARIAKTLSFKDADNNCILIVAAGDTKIDNKKYKEEFSIKSKMLTHSEALQMTGHSVGGICPFALPCNVKVYLDASLNRFKTVFPACGSQNSAIELAPELLFKISGALKWIDVTKPI